MWTPCKTKKERKEKVKALLQSSDKAVCRGLLRIYERQTASEQRADTTTDANGVGFSAFDAEILSSFAKQLLQGKTLSPRQMELARKKVVRYAGQLAEIAEQTEERMAVA